MQHKNSLRGGLAYALPLLALGAVIIIGVIVLITTNIGKQLTTSFTITSSGQLLEAESFILSSPLTVGSDPLAFSGKYISAESGASVKNTPSAAEASFSINVPTRATYYIWVRMFGPSGTNDAAYVGIDSTWDRVFPVNTGAYEWVKVEKTNGSGAYGFSLKAGTHKLKITHGETLARVDAIFMSTKSSPTLPVPPPPSMNQLYEAESFTLSSPMTSGSDVNALGGKYISVNSGTSVSTPAAEATLSISVPATNTYYIWARVMGPTSGNDASYFGIDSQWDRVFPSAHGVYEWVKVETANGSGSNAFSLTPGSHTLKIGHGEVLVRIDAVYVSTNANPNLPVPTVTATPAPTVSLSASPVSITAGESSTLTWSSTDTTSCTASGSWTGTKVVIGSETVTPSTNATYTLSCTGAGGSASKSVIVSVSVPADTTAPTVSISSPATGMTYSSAQTVSIAASASDNVGVTKVEFYDGATLKSSDNTTPYSHSWSFTSADNGTHSWTAKAYDVAGNVSVSAAIALTVDITLAPTVSLSASPASITSGGSSTLTWSSTNSTACTASGAWAGTKSVSGTEVVMPTANSTYTLACTGAGGTASNSATVSVGVASDTTLPTVSISSPTTGASYTSAQTVSIAATASDNVGVTKVEFYDNGILKGTPDTTSPYSHSWSFTSADNGTHSWTAKAYDAAGNVTVSSAVSLTVNIASGGGGLTGFNEGFGATIGGYGQPVYYVTNLNDSGAGSLRDAVSQGNRYVKFLVAGTITLATNLKILQPFITVDGLSAPPPGITLANGGVYIYGSNAHDIIVSGIRVRNVTKADTDAFSIGYQQKSSTEQDERDFADAHHIVLDHVSTRLGTDGAIDVSHGSHDVTVQWSIFEENISSHNLLSLNKYGTERVTYHHNLFIKGGGRQPEMGWQPNTASHTDVVGDVRNNLVWDYLSVGTRIANGGYANVINNYYYTSGTNSPIKMDTGTGSKAYTSGNVSQNGYSLNDVGNVGAPFPAASVTMTDACTAAKAIKAQAGPRIGGLLDAVDAGYVNAINITCN